MRGLHRYHAFNFLERFVLLVAKQSNLPLFGNRKNMYTYVHQQLDDVAT